MEIRVKVYIKDNGKIEREIDSHVSDVNSPNIENISTDIEQLNASAVKGVLEYLAAYKITHTPTRNLQNLKYTKEKPTAYGYYYAVIKVQDERIRVEGIVFVYSSDLTKIPNKILYEDKIYELDDECFLEFAGPISKPM